MPVTPRDRVIDPLRHLAGDGTARRRQGPHNGNVAVITDVDLIDQSQLIDVDWDLGVVDGLERHDDVGGQLLDSSADSAESGTGVPSAVTDGGALRLASAWPSTVIRNLNGSRSL